ncbi:MAG TPA: Tad domain-containing protein, partial [Acidimicrobiia bacterium]|nr:Tad domain-containing protein [Acidimicrobiia bacterium]
MTGSGMGNIGAGNRNDRGAVAVLVAASLVMLMGFAALAVDIGAAFSERRQDQSAADMASMTALQFARGSSNPATAANNGAAQALAVANASLDNPAAADWATCVDPTPLTIVSSTYPCVSFTANLQRSRVLIPTIEVETTFGRVLGVTSIATSAFAEAQADLGQEGRVLPFGLPSGAAGDTEVCLRDGPNAPPPCDGPDSGNFGTLDFSLYGNGTTGTQQTCGNAQAQNKLRANMVAGVDHPVGTISSDPGVREDGDYCPIFNSRPNHVDGQTGGGSALYDGMVAGSSTLLDRFYPGRIARGPNTIPVENGSPGLDDTGLWTYLDGVGAQPTSCNTANDTPTMATCLSEWRLGSFDNPLFSLDIENAVRLGAAPQIDAETWGTGTQTYGIVALVPVYLEGSFWGCTGGGGGGG